MSRNQACGQFEERVQNQLDQRMPLTADPWIVNHVQDCTSCAELLHDYQVFMVTPRAACSDGYGAAIAVQTQSRTACVPVTIPAHKLLWSIGPTFAALLIVVISISLNERQYMARSDRSLLSTEVFAFNVHSVAAQRGNPQLASQVITDPASLRSEDAFLAMTSPNAIRQCLYNGVIDYSSSAYQFAHAATNLDGNQLLPNQWMEQLTSPIEWLDVTATPYDVFLPSPVRQLLTLGVKFLSQALDGATEPDLGFSPDFCAWKHAA